MYIYLIKEGLVQEQYKSLREYKRIKGRISNIANLLNPLELNLVSAKCLQPTIATVVRKGELQNTLLMPFRRHPSANQKE